MPGWSRRESDLTVARDSHFLSPESFDRFFFDDDFSIKKLENVYKSEGIGVPLIALRRFNLKQLEGRKGEEKFLMPRQVYPMTAVLKPGPTDPDGGFTCVWNCTTRSSNASSRSAAVPTAGLGPHDAAGLPFRQSPLPILQEIGLLDPQWLKGARASTCSTPTSRARSRSCSSTGFAPARLAWMQVINDLRGDAFLRDGIRSGSSCIPPARRFPVSAAQAPRGAR